METIKRQTKNTEAFLCFLIFQLQRPSGETPSLSFLQKFRKIHVQND